MNILEIAIWDGAAGSVIIREDDLPRITRSDLRRWEISRTDLHRCFVEGVELMQGRGSDRVRPFAAQRLDGEWEVLLVGYSPYTDPLMQGSHRGRVR